MYDKDGNSTELKTEFPTIPDKYAEEYTACNGVNIPFTVNHPTLNIEASPTWNIHDRMLIWNDPKRTERADNEEVGEGNWDKSMFDPCPPGWRVPLMRANHSQLNDHNYPATSNCYCDFFGYDRSKPTTTVVYGYNSDTRKGFFDYYPMGYINEMDNPHPQVIHFPCQQGECFQAANLTVREMQQYVIRFYYNSTIDWYHSYASRFHTLRCVKENYQL
jgi:hypothetical protein